MVFVMFVLLEIPVRGFPARANLSEEVDIVLLLGVLHSSDNHVNMYVYIYVFM